MDGQQGRKTISNMQLHVDRCLKQMKWSKHMENNLKRTYKPPARNYIKASDLQEFHASKKKKHTQFGWFSPF